MCQETCTNVSGMRIRRKQVDFSEQTNQQKTEIDWQSVQPRSRGEAFLKNLAVASALVLCAIALRTGAIPQLSATTDVVLTATTDHSLLDEQLGKLSFVSALFPETVLVFGESKADTLSLPVSGSAVTHVWSEQEPYISWRAGEREVYAAASGEVMGVYHGVGDEWLVKTTNADGLSCVYGNLQMTSVQMGDVVTMGDPIGIILPGENLVLEVFSNGRNIDPTDWFSK